MQLNSLWRRSRHSGIQSGSKREINQWNAVQITTSSTGRKQEDSWVSSLSQCHLWQHRFIIKMTLCDRKLRSALWPTQFLFLFLKRLIVWIQHFHGLQLQMLLRLLRVSMCDSFDYSSPVAGRPSVISLLVCSWCSLLIWGQLAPIRKGGTTKREKIRHPIANKRPGLWMEQEPIRGAESRSFLW